MTEAENPQTKENFINEGLSLVSLAMSGVIFILCVWGWRCKKRWECKKKESDDIVVQNATVVEEAGSTKPSVRASAPPAPPGLAAAPEPRTYSGTYSITMAESA